MLRVFQLKNLPEFLLIHPGPYSGVQANGCAKNGYVLGYDARNEKAVITGNSLVRSGGFKMMVFGFWAYKVFSAIAILAKMMIFFIVLGLGLYRRVKEYH